MPELRLSSGSLDLDRGLMVAADGGVRSLTALDVALLRYLCERPSQDVSRDELVREVWGGEGEGRVVDFAIRRLRQKLGEPKNPRHILTAHGYGYRFVPLAEVATRSAPTSRRAIPLASGDLLLEERRFVRDGQEIGLSHIESRLLSVLAGAIGQPVPRERLAASVWGRGQHNHTLEVTLARLRGKIERSPESPEVLVTVRGEGIALVGLSSAGSGHLPMPESSFVDRPERAWALRLIEQHPLVTLLGTAGLGKTRLALEVGASWRQSGREVWFCDLTRVGRVDRMISSISTLLGGEARSDREGVRRILGARPRGTLVILDNLEHLLECAPIVEEWMGEDSPARFLVTSRAPLGLSREHVLPVAPLGEHEAVKLFFERTSDGEHDPDTVAVLAERLDRLPLAIELAAALTERMGAREILDRLGERLDLLVLRPEGATSQHSTLRAALEWSWHLLDRSQQEVLACCAVFCADFGATDAAAIVGRDVGSALEALERRSLLQPSARGYRLLMSIRDFARERLALSGALPQVIERHAEHFVALGERCAEDLYGPWTREASERLAAARDDLLAALESTGRPDTRGRLCRILSARGFIEENAAHAARLSRALSAGVGAAQEPYLWITMASCSRAMGRIEQAREALGRAASLAHPADRRLQICLAFAAARTAIVSLDLDRAMIDLDSARASLSEMPASHERLRLRAEEAALRSIAAEKRALESGALGAWEEQIREGLMLARELGDVYLIGQMHRMTGRMHKLAGQLSEALEHYKRALSVARAAGRKGDERQALLSMAHLEHEVADLSAARAHIDEYEAISREMGHGKTDEVELLRGFIALELGDFDISIDTRGVALPTMRLFSEFLLFDILIARDDPASALAISDEPTLRRAAALAMLGRTEEARSCAERSEKGDVWWRLRVRALLDALVCLEEARGTPAQPEAERAARALLAGGAIVEHGGSRFEVPYDARALRRWLERALSRGSTGRS